MGRKEKFLVNAHGSPVQLLVEPGMPAIGEAAVRRWVQRAVGAIVGDAGQFPVKNTYVVICLKAGVGAGDGTTHAIDPSVFNISIDRDVTQAQFNDDWVLVHEMAHLFVPPQSRKYRWLEEGFAVYVEAMARMQAGMRCKEDTWAAISRGLPHGQKLADEGGLDGTTRSGRIYWGGMAWMLLPQEKMQAENATGWIEVMQAWMANGWDIRSEIGFAEMLALQQ